MRQYVVILILMIVSACGNPDTSVIDRQVLEEMDQMEPRRITRDQLVRTAYRQGRDLSDALLTRALSKYSADTTFAAYLARQTYDTTSAQIEWVSQYSDTLRLNAYERQLWGAYRYSAERADPITDNVQRLAGDSLLYTRPLVLTDSLRQQLPNATDTLGQLLGMWSITWPKKEIVLGVE